MDQHGFVYMHQPCAPKRPTDNVYVNAAILDSIQFSAMPRLDDFSDDGISDVEAPPLLSDGISDALVLALLSGGISDVSVPLVAPVSEGALAPRVGNQKRKRFFLRCWTLGISS